MMGTDATTTTASVRNVGRRDAGRAARRMVLPAALMLAALACAEAHAITVTKATDVCASDANPCAVTSVLDIPNGLCTNNNSLPCTTNTDCTLPGFCKLDAVVLDFGIRDVSVTGAGQFNFGTSSGSILCGDFAASTTNPAIDANGVDASGSDSGQVRIFSRRLCSVGNPAFPCLNPSDCKLGECKPRRCQNGTTKVCLGDADCSVGPCIQKQLKKICTKDESRSCITNADCELGACPLQTTCSGRGTNPINCATNSDCDFGTCTTGTASITMGGSIVGNSEYPAFIDLRATDDITITKSINLTGTTPDSDGGELSVDATFGSITVAGAVTAKSGGFSTGGDVSLYAGTDVVVSAEIDITGGDYDGGTIDVDAGRDVAIGRSILANSGSGAGFGGEFLVVAGRDLSITGVSSSSKTGLETSGHANLFNEAGDGGAQDFTADRNLSLGVNTRIISNGSAPDALGGDIVLDASGNFEFHGDVTAKALGANGGGGTLEGYSGGTMTIGPAGTVDLTGGGDGAGDLQFYGNGNLGFSGLADLSASNGGNGGSIYLDSNEGDANISGTLRINSGGNGDMDVNACRITLTGTGQLDAGLTDVDNTLTAHESMKLLNGSLMKTGPAGINKLVYRTAAKPPIINGTVSPAAVQVVNPALVGCPVCGNSEIDQGETCDDGNTTNGDKCNSQCQNEKCVTQTAPKIPCTSNADCGAFDCDLMSGFCGPWELCEDGNVCTTDTCNTALNLGTCQHVAKNCADAHACTVDSCDAATGNCLHAANDAACADQNPCTDNICVVATGCSAVANDEPCNDNNSCTENDACVASQCTGTPIGGCGVCGDGAVNGSDQCDDGNATFVSGEYCGEGCVLIPCGKPTNSTGAIPKSSDAQFTLRAAVGLVDCCPRVCDADNTQTIVASDAQRILRKAVGQVVTLNCPTTGVCPPYPQ